jgi:hypothetical protein
MNDGFEPDAPAGRALPAAGAASPDAVTLGRCLTEALGFIEQLHGKVTSALEETIERLSADADAGEDDRQLLEEFRLLQRDSLALGRAFQSRFTRQYREDVRAGQAGGVASVAAPAGDGGFSLVDDQQLEEWLAIDRLVGKIGDRHGDEIKALTQRFQRLAPDSGGACPLGPDRFCQAFNGALESLEVAPKMRIRCFELLYRILVPDIGEFYARTNRYLIERGILPALRIEAVAQTSARTRTERRRTATAPQSQAGAEEAAWSDEIETGDGDPDPVIAAGDRPTPIQEQMFMAMQHLLRAHFRQDGAGDEVVAALPVTPMLIDTLSMLQRDDGIVEQAGELIRGGLRQQLTGHIAGGREGAGINRIDDETIDVISMIFDYILDDRSLPDFMKALIGRLQIPVLKVAIIDREFFSRKSHPARQLLNELSHAGVGWREESEAAMDRLYQKMETVVRRIIDEFDNELSIFDDVLREFRAYLDEEERGFNEARTRLLESAQQNERRERLTLRLAEMLAKRLVDRDLPAELREYLLTPWRERAVDVLLAEGEDSAAARATFGFLDDLLWSLEPKPEPEGRKRLVGMLPVLLETLRDGLGQAGYAGEDMERVILSLQERHFESLKAGRRATARPDPPQAAAPVRPDQAREQETTHGAKGANDVDRMLDEISQDLDELSSIDLDHLANFSDVIEPGSAGDQRAFERMIEEMGLEFDRDEGPRVDDEFTEQVRRLDPGDWVELSCEDGATLRGKLAWKGDDYSSFSFVNRQYKVVAERPFYVLAEEFRQGRARVIEDVALFDRAVDGVISGIVRLAAAAGR